MMMTIKEAAKFLGVSVQTLRRWEDEGKITSLRTTGNHRRYDPAELVKHKNGTPVANKLTIAYARVSSSDQKEDLVRQVDTLSVYCAAKGYQFKVIEDLGSGLNYNKKGLKELIELICSGTIERVVINYKDRLVRFGYEMIEQLCSLNNVELEIVNHSETKTYEEELVEDVLSVITVFSARLYGSRSHKAKKIVDESKKLFE